MSTDAKAPPNLSPPDGEKRIDTESDDGLTKDDIVTRVRHRYEDGVSAFEENRRMHSEDLNFVYNSEAMGQWDPVVLEARKGKPCYTFNRCIGPVNIVVADMRQTRPAGKVRPVNESANEATAEVLAGIMRSIEDDSRADVIYKNQYKFAVAGGFGAWRILPEYADDDTFDQVLRIHDIANPQTVIWDPECSDPCGGDAMWCMVGERISKDKYSALYPVDDMSTFYISRDSYGWFTDKEVRIVEYWERVPFKKTIAKLSNGQIIDYDAKERAVEEGFKAKGDNPAFGPDKVGRVVETREVIKWRVMWCKVDGTNVLEGPEYYDWKKIPVVRVPGRYVNIEGRKKFQSLIRHAKDAQRTYNSRINDMIERSALAPKAPYLATEKMIKGYEAQWAQANTSPRPYLPYNVDEKAEASGGAPERVPPIDFPQAALALAQSAAQDIQATTGFFDPALGNADDMNRVSGKALVQHTRRSDLGSFEFIDGFNDALQLTWEMGIDMIPTVYDNERVMRIIGQDGVEKMVAINQQDPQGQDVIHDLTTGKYTCKVTIGPSFQTARQETLDTLINFGEAFPQAAAVIPDLVAKNLDSPDADELARRLRIPLIRQGLVQPTQQEQSTMPPPPQPDPMVQAKIQREQALAKRDSAQAEITQGKLQMMPVEQHTMIYKSAGQHLTNMKTATEMGNQAQAAQAEAQAANLDLQHQAASGIQDLAQQGTQHIMDVGQANEAHGHEMRRMHERHQMEMTHAKEKHEQDLVHAKALGEAKAKAAAKAKPASPKK